MPSTPAQFLLFGDELSHAERGTVITLDGDEGRHAAKVARTRVGETILLTDRTGRQVRATVTDVHKESLSAECEATATPPLRRVPRLALVQALAAGGRDEQAVESATELGVDRVTPWIADRSISVWRGPKLTKGRVKWENISQAAVKQCRRAGFPSVDEPVTSAQLVTEIAQRCQQGGVVLVLHEQESVRITQVLRDMKDQLRTSVQEITIVVGPEGGITEQECEDMMKAGARTVLLGPEVLRSSTAGPAAIAMLSAHLGRWDTPEALA